MSDQWRDRRVLVTGATGLVGSWLVRRLVGMGAEVVALVRDWDPRSELIRSGTIHQVRVVSGDLAADGVVERAVNEHEVDTVFHLGAQTIVGTAQRSPVPTFEANIRGTYLLLDACRRHQDLVARVLIASSDKAYGSSEVLPYTEELPPLGRFPYEVSKSCADLIAQSYFHAYELPVVIARCGNIYGGGDLNWSRLVPGTIRSLLRGEPPVIRSDGTFLRDYVFVEDAVDAYLHMADALEREGVRGEAFNFGPEAPRSVLEVVDELRRLLGREDLVPEILGRAEGEIHDQYVSAAKAERLLDWRPRHSLADGLHDTVGWYREYFERTPSALGAATASSAR